MHELFGELFFNWWFCGSATSFIVWLLREKEEPFQQNCKFVILLVSTPIVRLDHCIFPDKLLCLSSPILHRCFQTSVLTQKVYTVPSISISEIPLFLISYDCTINSPKRVVYAMRIYCSSVAVFAYAHNDTYIIINFNLILIQDIVWFM